MTLDYIYHSGFAIEMEGVTIIIDTTKILPKRNTTGESCMIISCKGRVNCTYWPPISIPTTSTVKY